MNKISDTLTRNYYVYNSGIDTIFFTKLNYGSSLPLPSDQTKIVDSIQVNGTGAKEIVFFRAYSFFEERHGGTFDVSESTRFEKYEIWDLDSKKVLFEAISFFQKNCQNYEMGVRKNGNCLYSYDLKIDSTGTIKISKTKEVLEILNGITTTFPDKTEVIETCVPNYSEGIYQFKNGKYEKVE